MFSHAHYVAAMQTKPAELRALRAVAPALCSRITPLLECPPRAVRDCQTREEHRKVFRRVVDHLTPWSGRSIFADLHSLGPKAALALDVLAAELVDRNITPVPVVSMKTPPHSELSESTRAVLCKHGYRMCLRLSPAELKSSDIQQAIETRIVALGAAPPDVDLIIDQRCIDSGSLTYPEFASRVPWPESWRTLTLLAGSFPEDLADLERGMSHRLRRIEWRRWKDLETWQGRRPAFGDYAIRHVLFKEPVPVPNVSASVRYTTESHFLVLRGEGIRNPGGPGPGQWNAWATLLRGSDDFFGAHFSAGDRYVADRAEDWSSTGSAQSWLQAGFSHHLTLVALQVANQLDEVREVAAASDWTSAVQVAQVDATW